MYTVLLVIHIMVTLALIITILVQRSATDSMGLSGSSSNSFMSGRAKASFITRTTSVLAAVFMLTSLGLGIITARSHTNDSSIMDNIEVPTPESSAAAPVSKEAPVKKTSKPVVPRPE